MSDISAEQLAQRVYDRGLMTTKELEQALAAAGGRGLASFNDFIMVLLEQEHLTNWQISRLAEGHHRGFFYGDWRVLYLIGAGTFARVYRAAHRETGEVKAVKVLRQRYSNDANTRDQFLREATMVMELRHPNIVPIFEVEEDNDRIYMVMDFVEGQNLRQYVKAHKKIDQLTALRIVRDVVAGLAYAAARNIYHRDMKLSNVLLSANGQAKLVDFGLATVSGDKEDDGVGGPRSIDYAGLERCTHVGRNDTRSDIFFVGCMLYEMVCGVPPLSETRERIRRLDSQRYTDTVPATMHDPKLPHRIVILINRLMEIDPEKRVQTAEQARIETEAAIQAVQSGDTKQYDAELSQQEAIAYEAQINKKEEGRGKTVLLIESNIKLQDSLRERLKSSGYRVLITNNLVGGLKRFEGLEPTEDAPVDCVIFGSAGLGRDALVGFEQFATSPSTSLRPAILLTTEKLTALTKPDWFNECRQHLSLPIKIKRLKLALRELMGIDPPRTKTAPNS